jgi:hypothetical protein
MSSRFHFEKTEEEIAYSANYFANRKLKKFQLELSYVYVSRFEYLFIHYSKNKSFLNFDFVLYFKRLRSNLEHFYIEPSFIQVHNYKVVLEYFLL